MIRHTRLFHTLAALLAALFVTLLIGCAPKVPPGTALDSPKAAWIAFRQNYCVKPKAPAMKVKASLYYSRLKPIKRTNRTLMTMWGDFGGPMRLDVSASIGKRLAHIRENGDGLLVFYPTENVAYTHIDPVLGATRLGMPFPFSLNTLSSVVMGDYSGLVPKKYAEGMRSDDTYVYDMDNGLVDRVTLDITGRPVLVEGRTTKAYADPLTWRLEINKYEETDGTFVPSSAKLTLALSNGEKGILHVKSREFMVKAWPESSTDLALPEGVVPTRLDMHYYKTEHGNLPVIHEDK